MKRPPDEEIPSAGGRRREGREHTVSRGTHGNTLNTACVCRQQGQRTVSLHMPSNHIHEDSGDKAGRHLAFPTSAYSHDSSSHTIATIVKQRSAVGLLITREPG